TPSQAERRAIIESRLGFDDWPARKLKTVAVDVATGQAGVFDASSGVSLVDAVCASCAVPGAWPAVSIQGRQYMDGGGYSITNAQVAEGAGKVIVLAPFGYSEGNPVAGHLHAEVSGLRNSGSQVKVIEPDAASRIAIGDNVLDPSRK